MVRTNADYKYTSVAVDQVMAADGNYQVLFLGTGMNVDRSCRSVRIFGFVIYVKLMLKFYSEIYISCNTEIN